MRLTHMAIAARSQLPNETKEHTSWWLTGGGHIYYCIAAHKMAAQDMYFPLTDCLSRLFVYLASEPKAI